MNYYKTGEFAQRAGVSQRTIRYYDTIGLLKPSRILENGYRQYNDKDLIRLQKILSLRNLGFSIDEIFPIVQNDDNMMDSLDLQLKLVDQQILHLQNIKDAILTVKNTMNKDTVDWEQFHRLVQLSSHEMDLVEQYKTSKNLMVRISLHDQFSVNPVPWFSWIQSQIDFSRIHRLIEIGCGNGKLWESTHVDLRNREIFLTDKSQGMIEEVRHKLGNDFNCMVADCQAIPFKDAYFDAVVANHVLFYLSDLRRGLKEIHRILRPEGLFYCSAYGKDHMKEIARIAAEFDPGVKLSQSRLYEIFGLENGKKRLNPYFNKVELKKYEDALLIDRAGPIVDYIMSCHGNQNERVGPRYKEFTHFIEDKIARNGPIHITKEAGLFICVK